MSEICVICGEQYEPSRSNQKCCSRKCGRKRWKLENYEKWKAIRNKYQREYYNRNKEKCKKRLNEYLKKKRRKDPKWAERENAKRREWVKKNPDRLKKYWKKSQEKRNKAKRIVLKHGTELFKYITADGMPESNAKVIGRVIDGKEEIIVYEKKPIRYGKRDMDFNKMVEEQEKAKFPYKIQIINLEEGTEKWVDLKENPMKMVEESNNYTHKHGNVYEVKK